MAALRRWVGASCGLARCVGTLRALPWTCDVRFPKGKPRFLDATSGFVEVYLSLRIAVPPRSSPSPLSMRVSNVWSNPRAPSVSGTKRFRTLFWSSLMELGIGWERRGGGVWIFWLETKNCQLIGGSSGLIDQTSDFALFFRKEVRVATFVSRVSGGIYIYIFFFYNINIFDVIPYVSKFLHERQK